MATYTLSNGQQNWEGKTRTAAETKRDKHLNRLFEDSNWEPIVIPFPQGVMIGFLNCSGSWESYTVWYYQSAPQRRVHGCTLHNERDKKQVLIGLHRHVAALVRDSDGTAAGLEYLWHEDHEGKEDYLQISKWQAACKAARENGKGDVEAREVADVARAEFANRPEREPVRSLANALLFLETGNPVPVSKHLWHECRDTALLAITGLFLVLRQGQIIWCNDPCSLNSSAWISNTLLTGYVDQSKQYCLLQLNPDDQVLPVPVLPLTARDLAKE